MCLVGSLLKILVCGQVHSNSSSFFHSTSQGVLVSYVENNGTEILGKLIFLFSRYSALANSKSEKKYCLFNRYALYLAFFHLANASSSVYLVLNILYIDLQIYAVTPIPESQDVLQREGIPDNIKSFYKVNHIWRFRYDRPFHKGTKDKDNEFKVYYHSNSH